MKFVIFALTLCLGSQASAQVATLEELTGSTGTPVEKMTSDQLSKHLGKNVVRLAGACTVSSWFLALSAVTETIPVFSAAISNIVTIKFAPVAPEDRQNVEFDMGRDKDLEHMAAGGGLSFAADLAKIGYQFTYEDNGQALEQALEFPNTKMGYAATTALAKRFYGDTENGECAKAGRQIVDVLTLIQANRR